ncbi:DUF3578 domain-containing protein [Guptibacillus algicola]|uniref:DUF3578 domain-containing protein n=1 Tax=Guptibacillus algicola TaxID=225844 RepID=UPI001CD6476B|nr:DUF3578 domain-containing protein [Alkalihalobacillus algicola]MCA0987262.1 DUF3578 domain-containing protein [Alkalihalobacillus algicola]
MKLEFERILLNYNKQLVLPFKPTENKIAKFIINEIPIVISNKLSLHKRNYKVQSSVGQGNWTETPWIGIFDRSITSTATKGFYIVYLFRKDMKGFYLSLNQGTTYIQTKYKGNKPRGKMKETASKIREIIYYSDKKFPLTDIELGSSTNNAKNYMAAHICGKYYSFSSLPESQNMVEDLRELIKIYQQLKIVMGWKDTAHFIDYLLNIHEIEDTQFQSDVQLASPAKTPRVPQIIPNKERRLEGYYWRRDSSISREAIHNSSYQCENNPSHTTFTSDITGENFVEAHHLIPLQIQEVFKWSLDVPGNIVALCPNCHRRIHHANKSERDVIINKLFKVKEKELSLYGHNITIEKLIKMYDENRC